MWLLLMFKAGVKRKQSGCAAVRIKPSCSAAFTTASAQSSDAGITSIIEELGTMDFWRMRCGIGKNFPPGGMVEYVLANFASYETEELNAMITRACDSLEFFISAGAARAMQKINAGLEL